MTGAAASAAPADGPGTRAAWSVLRLLRGLVLTATAALGVVSLLAVAAGLVLDVRPLVVISGSMEPTIPVGSLIAGRTVPAAEVQVGDVVTVPRREGTTDLVTHRVVEVRSSDAAEGARELVLRGDANASDDASPYTVTEVRRLVLTVPGAGYLVQTLQTPRGLVLLGGVLLAAVVLTFAVPSGAAAPSGRRRAAGRADRRGVPDPAGPAPAPPGPAVPDPALPGPASSGPASSDPASTEPAPPARSASGRRAAPVRAARHRAPRVPVGR
jgi:signal peptidase I